jgi:predicted RNA methylase
MASVGHPVFARAFPAMSRALQAGEIAGHREDLLASLAGQVIDVGTGTGPSFGHYPDTVTRVLAVEPEPRLRALAAAAAQAAPVPIEVTGGMASVAESPIWPGRQWSRPAKPPDSYRLSP